MKLLIDDEYVDVGFWSFLKCNFITGVVTTTLIYALITIMFAIIGMSVA